MITITFDPTSSLACRLQTLRGLVNAQELVHLVLNGSCFGEEESKEKSEWAAWALLDIIGPLVLALSEAAERSEEGEAEPPKATAPKARA